MFKDFDKSKFEDLAKRFRIDKQSHFKKLSKGNSSVQEKY